MEITKEEVLNALSHVDDPDLNKDIVSLGMVRDVNIEGKKVSFRVVLTTPACPMKETIRRACINAIIHYVNKEADVDITMDAEVTNRKNLQAASLHTIKNIIAVASGKGGVGKSTMAANLAVALAMKGAKVGLIDADIYGPSVPIMFDVLHERPMMRNINGKNLMVPVESHGVKLLSIGFFAEANQAIVWRGPMASRALNQLFMDADWGELDYLFVDLPPGTGDIHLSLVQAVPVSAAIVVSTPQEVALADARKGIAMFGMDNIKVPVLGIIENMSWFSPPELPDKKYYLFGKEGAKNLAAQLQIPLLGQIPVVESIRESGDLGRPAVLNENSPQYNALLELAENAAREISILNAKNNIAIPTS
ncbi:MAG: Mrp/NBP35 family ATP-binding protein [Bacteroidota bacterium]|jgi:ATP-binding protein involved in chromosome partitioning